MAARLTSPIINVRLHYQIPRPKHRILDSSPLPRLLGPMAYTMAAVNASLRQKDCNPCVQSKRRCDRRTLLCSSCMARKISCAYGKAQADIGTQSREESIGVVPYMESLEFGGSAGSPFPFLLGLSLDVDYLEAHNNTLPSPNLSTHLQWISHFCRSGWVICVIPRTIVMG
jgi:hypothetical protein